MMKITPFSFHGSHSGEFCAHAMHGISLEQILEKRIAAGQKFCGISEHIPIALFDEKFRYPEEMEFSAEHFHEILKKYFATARALQKKFAGEIEILVGLETEMPTADSWKKVEEIRTEFSPDFLVGSVHHIFAGAPIDFSPEKFDEITAKNGGVENLFLQYFARQKILLEKCRPEVVGHFDLIKLFAPRDFQISREIEAAARENIEIAIRAGALFEVNSRVFRKIGEPAPGAKFLKIIRELSGKITIGDDSHGISDIGILWNETLEFVKDCGFDEIFVLRKSGEKPGFKI